jgi:hypothetical protein
MKKTLLTGLAFLLIPIGQCLAGTVGVSIDAVGFVSSYQNLMTLGYEFTVNSATSVTELGVFDYLPDDIFQPQQVGLWNNSGTLLASTYVSSSDQRTNYFRFHAITPVALTPGQDYIVASQGGEPYSWWDIITTAPQLTFIQPRYHFNGNSNNSPLIFPDQIDDRLGMAGIFGGNVMLSDGSPVPEPATMLLFGTGIAGLIIARRKKKS